MRASFSVEMAVLLLFTCCCWVLFSLTAAASCIENGVAVACNPPVQRNIATGLLPVASNTCGENGPERVCFRAGSTAGYAGDCSTCDANNSSRAHPASLITDTNEQTYWQSQSFRSVQHPNSVTITIPFNKTYSVQSISVLFQSARPESFSLLLSSDKGATFTPLHRFSRSCNSTYDVAESPAATVAAMGSGVLCTSDGAQVVPLTGGRSVYSASSYGQSPSLITDLRLKLDRLSTFGDELSWDPEVLDSYYYAIADIEITGACHCNGHAASCVSSVGGGVECNCTHNTAGQDCQQCLPSHNDRPWSPAVQGNARECVACNCNSHSSVCHFDMAVYLASGNISGGVCDNCQHNTTGRQCEQCQDGFYPNPDVPFSSPSACLECRCDPRGTLGSNGSCSLAEGTRNATGHCSCKANVVSPSCSRCRDGYFGLSQSNPDGCQECACNQEGSLSNICDSLSGQCRCKPGVGGEKCDRCLPQHIGFGENGCRACTCDPNGSFSSDCNQEGRCLCRPGFGESDCSVCANGNRRTESGCVACPACYTVLEEAFNRTALLLNDLQDAISRSRNASLIDSSVLRELNSSTTTLRNLQTLLASLTARERVLRNNIFGLRTQVASEQLRVNSSRDLLNSSENAFEETIEPLAEAGENVTRLMNRVALLQNRLDQAMTELSRILELHSMVQLQITELTNIARQATNISLEQQRTAIELFNRATMLMNTSANHLTLLCDLLERQNETLILLRNLQATQVLDTDDQLKTARPRLQEAVTAASNIMEAAEQVQTMVQELPRQDLMEDQLLSTAQNLQQRANEQLSRGRSLNEFLVSLRGTFTAVNVTARDLLRQAAELERAAAELTMRARAARDSANMSVTEGNEIIATSERLLSELRQRLEEVLRFHNSLQRLLEVIRQAETASSMAASEAERQEQEVINATRLVNEATSLLIRAGSDIQQAMEAAVSASSVADSARQAAQSLQESIDQVPSQLAAISSNIDGLQRRANSDSIDIAETNATVTSVRDEAASVERRVNNVSTMLDQLTAEVNSSRLLSPERISNINDTLTTLLTQVEALEVIIETTTQQVNSLEQQTQQLRNRYTELLHHRDLLLELQQTIAGLNCRSQFRPTSR